MKKAFVFVAALLAMASCKKDGKEEGEASLVGVLVGKWELVSQTFAVPGEGEHTVNVPADARPSYWTFASDGKLHVEGSYDFDHDEWTDAEGSGSYSLSGKILTLKTGNAPEVFEVKELTADRLTVVISSEGGGSIWWSFKKAR